MNYLAALLGLGLMGAVTTAAIYRGDAANYHAQLISLEASYSQAAQKAKDDAKEQEQKDLAAIQSSTSQAISKAQLGQQEAQRQLQAFQNTLKADAGMKDPGHVCSGVGIPKDILDALK